MARKFGTIILHNFRTATCDWICKPKIDRFLFVISMFQFLSTFLFPQIHQILFTKIELKLMRSLFTIPTKWPKWLHKVEPLQTYNTKGNMAQFLGHDFISRVWQVQIQPLLIFFQFSQILNQVNLMIKARVFSSKGCWFEFDPDNSIIDFASFLSL